MRERDSHPGVEQRGEVGVAGGIEVHRDGRDDRDGGVVEDVEERDLAVRLPQHEDERIQKLPVLCDKSAEKQMKTSQEIRAETPQRTALWW